ncbi:MAG: CBS domain-containing protein, partial [Lewinella sp.]
QKGRLNNEMNDYRTVGDLMISAPATISPDTTIKDAMHIMRNGKLGCLPVVKENELVGLITEMDFLRVAGRLIERLK